MKKQFFKHLPKFKKQSIECQKTFQQPIKQAFQRIKANYNLLDCVKLQNLLQTQKQVRPIEDSLKKQIFKFFLQKQLEHFQFLKSRSKVSTRILKQTKIKLEGVKYDWLQIWNRILTQFPEVPRKENFQLQQFLKIIKIFYDQNNALEVFNYFLRKHGDHSQYVFTNILIFSNITVNTKEEIFQKFLQELIQCYFKAQIKPKTLLVYFINLMKKRRSAQLPQETYKLLNNIILSGIITPSAKDAKSSIQSKFTKENAIMISQFVGKYNSFSVQTIKMLFQIVQKFVNPFENSTKAVRFLYSLIRFIWKRTQKQRKAKIRLQKLIQKQKKNEQQTKKQTENKQQTAQQQPADENIQNQQDQELIEDEEDAESDDDKQKQQALDEQLNQAEEEMLSNQIQQKKNKCYKILKNELSDQIINTVKDGIKRLFNYVYFVNSKKTVQQFIRYSFIMLPQLIIKSLDLLDKASQIPYINEEGLVMNIKITIQYMFSPSMLKESLNNLQRILDRIINCSKIIEVWPIYELLCAKLPLLDQKDLQKISQTEKQQFEKRFEINHDRFYQTYSGNVFSAFKRMIRQGQFFDEETAKSNSNCFEELLLNSYPQFKKLLFIQILEQITENRKNQFVYNFFNSHFVLTPQNQQIISEQLSLINHNESDQLIQLKNNLVMLLCYNKNLSELKTYIREFATKNSFRVVHIYHAIKAEFQLTTDPVSPSLKYFEENPKTKFKTTKSFQSRLNALEELRVYAEQLIEELHKLVLNPSSSTSISVHEQEIRRDNKSNQQIVKIACQFYKGSSQNQSSAKITLQNVGTRKKITQLLRIIYSIQGVLKHKVIDFDNQTMKFKSVCPINPRKSLLQNKRFIQILFTLISNETYMHDVKLTAILSELLTHELVFNYGNQSRQCKENMAKDGLANSYQELPQFCNRFLVMNSFRQKIKLLHFATLLNETKKQRAEWLVKQSQSKNQTNNQQFFDKVLNQIKILILAPGNQKSISLIKAILITNGLKGVTQFIMYLFRQTDIQSRFYWQKINQIFDQFKSYGVSFSVEQLIQLIDSHGKIFLLKDNKKLKQLAIKSFKHIITFIKQQQNNAKELEIFSNVQRIEKILRKYADHQKLKLIWLLSINFVLNSRKFTFFEKDHDKVKIEKIQTIWDFMQILEPMILSQTRIVRRLSLFIYSLCFRKIKKIVRISEIKKVQNVEYLPKTINQFIETGYLREYHISHESRRIQMEGKTQKVKCNDILMKISPYDEYQVSSINTNSELYQVFQNIQQRAFEFILKDDALSLKFITNFHTDMVSTAQQLLSMANSHQKATEMSQIVVKQLEESFYYFVPKKLNFDRVEIFFGQRFFKYLMIKDAKNNFKLVFSPGIQEILAKALTNLQSLDNQALVLIMSQDLIFAYQKYYQKLDSETRNNVESFILNVYSQMAKKSSGQIFKKWGVIFKKVENQKALNFLLDNMKKQIYQDNKRVCRNGLVYLTIKQNDFNQHIKVLKVLLQNRLELQNSIVNKIVNTILTQPQKFPIQKDLALKYKFIDFQKQLKEQMLQKSTQRVYFIRNTQFKEYLISILKSYIKLENQNNQSNQKFNDFIKNAYGLILNAINCFCHCFESKQNTQKICSLLDLIYEMSLNKQQTQILDYKQLQPVLKTIFSYQFQDVGNFETILKQIMKLVKVLPSKRQVQILCILLHRPYNFIMLSDQRYLEVLDQIFSLQETNNNYKELMSYLSVILSFRMPNIQTFIDLIAKNAQILDIQGKSQIQKTKLLIKNKKTKGKILLLYQCQELALLKLDKEGTHFILNESSKEKRNIWCRQMLSLRGKKQYLDDEQTFHIWQSIKANSNPYNYIV